MPSLVIEKNRYIEQNMYFKNSTQQTTPNCSKCKSYSEDTVKLDSSIISGLPDDVAKYCLALVPRSDFPAMGGVCKKWRSFVQNKDFIIERKLAARREEWLYFLTIDAEGKQSHWEVLDSFGHKHQLLPLMPAPEKAGFGVVVLNGKILVMAGYSVIDGTSFASTEVYQYDSCLNSWSKLANMNVARYDFACAEVNGKVYAVGGFGTYNNCLASSEVYNPNTDTWTMIESLRCPRWGCFACGLEGKLYIMGGRSTFTIGNSRYVNVYDPETNSWCEMKKGCVMVTAHTVLGNKLFCMEWKNQRKLSIFNSEDNSWETISIPLTGSSNIRFRFGTLGGKLLLFSLKDEPDYNTLVYDPSAKPGSEWQISELKSPCLCLCTLTIKI